MSEISVTIQRRTYNVNVSNPKILLDRKLDGNSFEVVVGVSFYKPFLAAEWGTETLNLQGSIQQYYTLEIVHNLNSSLFPVKWLQVCEVTDSNLYSVTDCFQRVGNTTNKLIACVPFDGVAFA